MKTKSIYVQNNKRLLHAEWYAVKLYHVFADVDVDVQTQQHIVYTTYMEHMFVMQ